MNARMRRLQADYDRIKDEFYGHRYVEVEPLEGNPPFRYLVTYNLKGLVWDKKEKAPVVIDHHEVEIYLHRDYPREKPQCKMRTKIFHPNFGLKVCIADYWAAGERLADIIIQIGQMIQYQNYNPKSPLNQEAARWTLQNVKMFPIGNVDLHQPEPEIVFGGQGKEGAADDLDIEFF